MRPAEEVAQRLARHHLDDAAEHVRGHAVVPARAGIVDQGQRRDGGGPFFQVAAGAFGERVQLAVVHRVDGAVAEESVGESGRVQEQIADEDGAAGRPGFSVLVDLDAGEAREDAPEFVVQRQKPVLDEDHRRDARDGLGHGVDAEDVVGLEGVLFADAPTLCVPVHDLAPAGHQGHDSRRSGAVDQPLHGWRDAGEHLAGHADFLGLGGGPLLAGSDGRGQDGPGQREEQSDGKGTRLGARPTVRRELHAGFPFGVGVGPGRAGLPCGTT